MGKRKGLGRGLDALLSAGYEADMGDGLEEASHQSLKTLPVEFLSRGKYQPRRDMHPKALEELTSSIRLHGIMQPVVVRSIGPDSYEIIAGERRWRAAQLAGLDAIPALIKDVSDDAALAMSLIENIQREDLNAIEEARALSRLQQEFELTQQQVAEAVSKSRSTVANLMRLMTLEGEVQKLLEHGDLEMGHARALLGLQGQIQLDAARTTVVKNMTVRQTESYVKRLLQGGKGGLNVSQPNTDIGRLEDKLSDQLGAVVTIKHNEKGKGRLILKYNSLDELDGILNHIK
jgi:ParB family chromosome partitioning protein|tara:strand:- start:2820 stop:3689 length:870 start_codon:yes stop_codon:yes gene_type:complete